MRSLCCIDFICHRFMLRQKLIQGGLIQHLIHLLLSRNPSLVSAALVSIEYLKGASSHELFYLLQGAEIFNLLMETYRDQNFPLIAEIFSVLGNLLVMNPAEEMTTILSFLINHPQFGRDIDGTQFVCSLILSKVGKKIKTFSQAIADAGVVPSIMNHLLQDYNCHFHLYRKVIYRVFVQSDAYLVVDFPILSSFCEYLSSSKEDDLDLICLCIASIITHKKVHPNLVIESGLLSLLLNSKYSEEITNCLIEITHCSILNQEPMLKYLIDSGLLQYLSLAVKRNIGKSQHNFKRVLLDRLRICIARLVEVNPHSQKILTELKTPSIPSKHDSV
jgi:hypothetical protein